MKCKKIEPIKFKCLDAPKMEIGAVYLKTDTKEVFDRNGLKLGDYVFSDGTTGSIKVTSVKPIEP